MHLQMYNKVDVGDSLSVDTVTAYLKKKFPKANAAKILGVDSSYDNKRKVGCIYFYFIIILNWFCLHYSEMNKTNIKNHNKHFYVNGYAQSQWLKKHP